MSAGGRNARRGRLAYAAYNVGLGVAGLAVLPALPWLLRPRARGELARRFGHLPSDVAALCGCGAIWIHAASVGEVLAAQPLVAALGEREPGRPLLITTTSRTGCATARTQVGVPATLLPVDLPGLAAGVLRRLRPAALVVLETEVWPNLFRAAGCQGVPLLMVSARLSARAAAGYAWVRPIIRSALENARVIAAQTAADAARFVAVGAPPERVRVLGSLKFARQGGMSRGGATVPVDLGARPVLVAASTQPGEEEIVLRACEVVWRHVPEAVLVLAPRRPERFAAVAEWLAALGVPSARRTAVADAVSAEVRVFLLDTVGELPGFFAVARAAFVGGTLVPLGGHNVLEPAAYGVPVCFGPHLDNVRDAANVLLDAGAATLVGDGGELGAAWARLLANPAAARAAGDRGRAAIEERAAIAPAIAALVQAQLRTVPCPA